MWTLDGVHIYTAATGDGPDGGVRTELGIIFKRRSLCGCWVEECRTSARARGRVVVPEDTHLQQGQLNNKDNCSRSHRSFTGVKAALKWG